MRRENERLSENKTPYTSVLLTNLDDPDGWPVAGRPITSSQVPEKTIFLPFPSQFLEHLFVKDGNSNYSDSVFHFGSDGTEL